MKSYKLISILLITAACSSEGQQDQNGNKLAADIDTFLGQSLERLKIPGMTILVTRNDSVIYSRAFGVRSLDTKEPMKITNVFHWASVSKTFVATAIMQLREQGKIDLDEKITTYLPYFRQKDGFYTDITIRQMLNHTSGIGDVDDYEWEKPQHDDGALERFVRSIASDKMLFQPGVDFSYSNTAFETLGAVIAKVSGTSFEDYMRQNIFEPLEMNASSFFYKDIPDSLRVDGHVWAMKAITSEVYPYNRMHAPSSTLNSNVVDMGHYAIAHLHRGEYKGKRILSDSSYNLLWTNSVNLEGKPKVGISWFIIDRHGVKTVSHSGGDTGFRSYLLLVPEKNISIMMASNYELLRSADFAYGVLDIILGEEPVTATRQIGFEFAEIMNEQGIEKAKEFYNKTKGDSIQRQYYQWDEDQAAFTYAGYTLLDRKLFPEAIELFKFNLEQFPNSGYAYGHLGSAYLRAGNNDLAKLNFIKAVELAPEEEYHKTELAKLSGKK
jgi:CubicO group peptidase (beta-lactamase class C family)